MIIITAYYHFDCIYTFTCPRMHQRQNIRILDVAISKIMDSDFMVYRNAPVVFVTGMRSRGPHNQGAGRCHILLSFICGRNIQKIHNLKFSLQLSRREKLKSIHKTPGQQSSAKKTGFLNLSISTNRTNIQTHACTHTLRILTCTIIFKLTLIQSVSKVTSLEFSNFLTDEWEYCKTFEIHQRQH